MNLIELISTFSTYVDDDDFVYRGHEFVKELKKRADAADAIEPILRLMEQHPDADFGSPGPLVHFIESFEGYEVKLLDSLSRQPVFYTLWMLNRIANINEGEKKKKYIELFKKIASDPSLDDYTQEQARDCLNWQLKNTLYKNDM